MDLITHQQLRDLAEHAHPPCISIYVASNVAGRRDVVEAPKGFRDGVKSARAQLQEMGMAKHDVNTLLEPVDEMLESGEAWPDAEHGLAMFIAPGYLKVFQLPMAVEDQVSVNDHFFIKPMLPLLLERPFYVVAVSQHNARVLKCTEHSFQQLPLPKDVALSKEEAAGGEDEHQDSTVRHAMDTSNSMSAGGSYHGQATDIQRKDHEDLMFFLRQLDDGVLRTIKDGHAPVVLAGADSVVPFYRQATNLKNIVDEFIPGNHDHTGDDILAERAREIMHPIWHQELNELQERFGTALAHELGSAKLDEVLPAAQQGRVDTLFVPMGVSLWGSMDEGSGRIAVHQEMEEGDEDLLEVVAAQTLLTSGRVVAVPPDQMPGNGDVAAIYRY